MSFSIKCECADCFNKGNFSHRAGGLFRSKEHGPLCPGCLEERITDEACQRPARPIGFKKKKAS